jgi:hypothetical protein
MIVSKNKDPEEYLIEELKISLMHRDDHDPGNTAAAE